MAEGVQDVFGETAEVVFRPLADGGEGTLDALLSVWGVEARRAVVVDALGRERTARYGISADGRVGMVEAAEANGLPAVLDVPLQPRRADTFGVGSLARELLDQGVDEVLLCIGGSASTDGGTGLLRALGARFLDADGREAAPGGAGLATIAAVDDAGLHPRARSVRWRVAVDVDNPLCGPHGAAAVFGPQKGAGAEDVDFLDSGLGNLAAVLAAATGIDMTGRPGAGAAGGMPATLVPLLGADTIPGSTLVADAAQLGQALAGASLALTGEGSFDSQSLRGKVVHAVTRLAPEGCAVVVIAGRVGLSAAAAREAGVTAAFSIADGPSRLEDLVASAAERVRETTAHACSLFRASSRQ
jgi:glycerate kinase